MVRKKNDELHRYPLKFGNMKAQSQHVLLHDILKCVHARDVKHENGTIHFRKPEVIDFNRHTMKIESNGRIKPDNAEDRLFCETSKP